MNGQDFQLTITRGPEPGKVIPLTSASMTIGRDPMSEITINDPEVSRRHANLLSTMQGYEIQDLGSTNGTFVDGMRLAGEAVTLEPGQVITIGAGVELVYEVVVEVDAQAKTVLEMDMELPELPQGPEPRETSELNEASKPVEPSAMSQNTEQFEERLAAEAQDFTATSVPAEDELTPAASEIAAEEESDAAQVLTGSPPQMGDEAAFEETTAFEEDTFEEPEPATSYDADDFAEPVVIPHEGSEEMSEEKPPFYRRMSTIIAALVLLILCCCCGFLVFFYYIGGDWLLRQMGLQ